MVGIIPSHESEHGSVRQTTEYANEHAACHDPFFSVCRNCRRECKHEASEGQHAHGNAAAQANLMPQIEVKFWDEHERGDQHGECRQEIREVELELNVIACG